MRAQSLLLYTVLMGTLVIWTELSTGLFGSTITRPAFARVPSADPSAARRTEVEPRDWLGHPAGVDATNGQASPQITEAAASPDSRSVRGDPAAPGALARGPEPALHASARNGSSDGALLASARGNVSSPPAWSGDGPFIALGIVSNCMWGNSFDRRYWIRRTFMTYSNVGRSMSVTFIAAMLPAGAGAALDDKSPASKLAL